MPLVLVTQHAIRPSRKARSHQLYSHIFLAIRDKQVGKGLQVRASALDSAATRHDQALGVVAPNRSQPLPRFAVGLSSHRTRIDDICIGDIACADDVKAPRLECDGQLLQLSLIQLAAQSMKRDAVMRGDIHVARL